MLIYICAKFHACNEAKQTIDDLLLFFMIADNKQTHCNIFVVIFEMLYKGSLCQS